MGKCHNPDCHCENCTCGDDCQCGKNGKKCCCGEKCADNGKEFNKENCKSEEKKPEHKCCCHQ